MLVAPSVAHSPGGEIGTGKRTCVPGPKANCRDVVHKWIFEHHGNFKGAVFTRAKLHGADLRGAKGRGVDLRGVILRHADLRGASFKNADFSPAGIRIRNSRRNPACLPNCQGADLTRADLSRA